MMRGLILWILSGVPAAAGCFTTEELPARAVYQGGAVLEYLGLEGGVLTYRTGETVTRMQDGLWPLEHKGGGPDVAYRWDTLLPDLAAVIADGGDALAEGRMQQGTGDWQAVTARIEVLGEGFYDWEDCRYQVVEFRKVMTVEGRKVSEGVVLFAPDALIAFRTDAIDPASGAVTSRELDELH